MSTTRTKAEWVKIVKWISSRHLKIHQRGGTGNKGKSVRSSVIGHKEDLGFGLGQRRDESWHESQMFLSPGGIGSETVERL